MAETALEGLFRGEIRLLRGAHEGDPASLGCLSGSKSTKGTGSSSAMAAPTFLKLNTSILYGINSM